MIPEKSIIHFAHANAYPPKVYTQFLKLFEKDFQVFAMKQRPLWENAKISEVKNWHILADDLIRYLENQNIKTCIGMGHSLGATITLFASLKRPDLFSRLVLIEPVLLPSWVYHLQLVLPHYFYKKIMPVAKIARKRKDNWESKTKAFEHFRSKKVFSRIPDFILNDFIKFGTKETNNDQVELVFTKEWEAHLYSRVTNPWKSLKHSKHPILGIRGEFSNTINKKSWQKWNRIQSNSKLVELKNTGHLVPFEEGKKIADLFYNWMNYNL